LVKRALIASAIEYKAKAGLLRCGEGEGRKEKVRMMRCGVD
jgi:hypothetical protein